MVITNNTEPVVVIIMIMNRTIKHKETMIEILNQVITNVIHRIEVITKQEQTIITIHHRDTQRILLKIIIIVIITIKLILQQQRNQLKNSKKLKLYQNL